MDPAVRVVGIAYHNMPQMGKQQHIWLHTVGAAEVSGDSSCLNIRVKPVWSQVAHKASSRRLGKGGTGGGDTDPTAEPTNNEPEEAYEGPGQTFGMVLLIVSISLFCTCTFGSIIIGNYILSRNADQNQSEEEPLP